MAKNNMSWVGKPPTWNRALVRKDLQKFYKSKKKEDSQVGLKINSLFQEFHSEMKLEQKDRNLNRLKEIVEQLRELRKTRLFKHEFPSFAMFNKYCKKEDLTLKDLLEV